MQGRWKKARARALAVVVEAPGTGEPSIAHVLDLSLLAASHGVRVPQLRRHDQVVLTTLVLHRLLLLLGRITIRIIVALQKTFESHFTSISLPNLILDDRICAGTCTFCIFDLLTIWEKYTRISALTECIVVLANECSSLVCRISKCFST